MRQHSTLAWKASPTRTPPPICTSTPFLKPRWYEEPWMPRTMLEIHDGRIPAMRGITALDESPLVLQRGRRGSRKQVFESADGIPSATPRDKFSGASKNFHKFLTSDRVFQTLKLAMSIRGYRREAFPDSFVA